MTLRRISLIAVLVALGAGCYLWFSLFDLGLLH